MTDPGQLYTQLVAAFNRHDWPSVRALAAPLLPLAARHAGVHYLVGIACLELHDLPHALNHLRQATELDATRAEFTVHYARALAMARLDSAAKAAADRAMMLGPHDARTLDLLGSVYAESLAHAAAADAFRQAASLDPAQPSHHYNLAAALTHVGDIANAEREIEACLVRDPLFWRAHLALSNLRRQTPATQHLSRLQALLAQHAGNREARLCLHFALAKEHEDLGEYPQAFAHYAQGNAAGRETIDYAPEQDAAIFAAMERAFPEPSAFAPGEPTAEPIFVFGLPRSGTTLVERILSSHPDVHAAGELQNFGMALRRVWNSPSPFWLDPDAAARTRELDWRRLGADYLASTRPGTGHAPCFVDKFPFNFLYAGFIAHALPNAKLVCLRRNPLDTCLGNFRQLFAEKLPYYHHTFDLLDAGRYYVMFDRLMAHWRRVLPDRILELRYEALVENQEAETRRLLAHCGLGWHDACLHFERNAAPVATASSLQVRQPLFRSSVGRWHRYERELEPLRTLLRENGIEPAT
ncbi:tetratricopeptide repeat-containing sulfotransferase family protein [Rhodanobacter geophilus]|uniref:Sulfotransferase n=1 Tax=Rhodanobacter geophilus TaxID=3162488 RepID=A0ABV3QJP7_9GAMM